MSGAGAGPALRLRAIREARGMTRYRLAQLSGVPESTLQMIENSDDPNPTFKVLCRVADALGVALDDLRDAPERSQ